MDYQYFLHAFLKYTENNLEYLIQNINHLVIQIYHSMLVMIPVNLSIKTCGSEVSLFPEFINIVSIFIIECNFIVST